jgi:hypothetical protein
MIVLVLYAASKPGSEARHLKEYTAGHSRRKKGKEKEKKKKKGQNSTNNYAPALSGNVTFHA